MVRGVQTAVLAATLLALGGCGDKAAPEPAAEAPAATQRTSPPPVPGTPVDPTTPTPSPDPQDLLELFVPKGVPTEPGREPVDAADLAVVKRWLAALTRGDLPAAADTFADGTLVQNLRPPTQLRDREARLEFNEGFPCGAEVVEAHSVKGYLVVKYRLTDRKDSPCDGPGGTAAGTIKVEGQKMTEWYRLPDPPGDDEEPAGPVV